MYTRTHTDSLPSIPSAFRLAKTLEENNNVESTTKIKLNHIYGQTAIVTELSQS
jgi:hypothetical protein